LGDWDRPVALLEKNPKAAAVPSVDEDFKKRRRLSSDMNASTYGLFEKRTINTTREADLSFTSLRKGPLVDNNN
jgi:hypothetical protein